MKRDYLRYVSLLMIVLIGLNLSSCSDDDNDEQGTKTSNIIGKWQLIEVTHSEYYESCDFEGWMNIKSDSTIEEYDACDGETTKSKWKLEGNELTVISDVLPIPFIIEIVSVDEKKMVVKFGVWGTTERATYKRL